MNKLHQHDRQGAGILPAPSVVEASNGSLSDSVSHATVVIPAEANLKAYDLLTVYWQGSSEAGSVTSYPLAITEDLAGKAYSYLIPGDSIRKSSGGQVNLWYTTQQVGASSVTMSRISALTVQAGASAETEDFERFDETVIPAGTSFNTQRLTVFNGYSGPDMVITASRMAEPGVQGNVLQIDNLNKKSGSLEILFNQPVSKVRFWLSTQLMSDTITFAATDENAADMATPQTLGSTTKYIEFVADGTKGNIHKLRAFYSGQLTFMELDNFSMTE